MGDIVVRHGDIVGRYGWMSENTAPIRMQASSSGNDHKTSDCVSLSTFLSKTLQHRFYPNTWLLVHENHVLKCQKCEALQSGANRRKFIDILLAYEMFYQ